MKTRIKEIKYADGKSVYKAQFKKGIKSDLRDFYHDFKKNPLLIILFLPLMIIPFFIFANTYNSCDFSSLEDAKEHIDGLYEGERLEKEKRENKKKSKKIVSKTYIKYP